MARTTYESIGQDYIDSLAHIGIGVHYHIHHTGIDGLWQDQIYHGANCYGVAEGRIEDLALEENLLAWASMFDEEYRRRHDEYQLKMYDRGKRQPVVVTNTVYDYARYGGGGSSMSGGYKDDRLTSHGKYLYEQVQAVWGKDIGKPKYKGAIATRTYWKWSFDEGTEGLEDKATVLMVVRDWLCDQGHEVVYERSNGVYSKQVRERDEDGRMRTRGITTNCTYVKLIIKG